MGGKWTQGTAVPEPFPLWWPVSALLIHRGNKTTESLHGLSFVGWFLGTQPYLVLATVLGMRVCLLLLHPVQTVLLLKILY